MSIERLAYTMQYFGLTAAQAEHFCKLETMKIAEWPIELRKFLESQTIYGGDMLFTKIAEWVKTQESK